MLLGQKVFYDVAKALQADAQRVKCELRAIAQGVAVQFVGFGPAFEGEMLEEGAAGAHSGGASRQGFIHLAIACDRTAAMRVQHAALSGLHGRRETAAG